MTTWNKDFEELCGLYPDIDLSLLICDKQKCTKNSTIMPTAWSYDDETSYLIRLQCLTCKVEWMVCQKCKLKKKLQEKLQISSHKWKYHLQRKSVNESADSCVEIGSTTATINGTTSNVLCNQNNIVTHNSDNYVYDPNSGKKVIFAAKRKELTPDSELDESDENEEIDIKNNKENVNVSNKRNKRSEIKWKGDDILDPNPPQVPFKKSSTLMNRHAELYIKTSYETKYYNNSDGGRRTKVVSLPDDDSSDESEYESPDEQEYYDPRQISKWKWETDYTSLPSDYDSSSSNSDDEKPDQERTIGKVLKLGMHKSRKHGQVFHTINGKLSNGSPDQFMLDNFKTSCGLSMLTTNAKDTTGVKLSVARVQQDMYLTQANNLEYYEMNDNTMAFYSHEVLGKGQNYLVARASESRTKTWNDVMHTMGDREADHECKMAKFVNSLTRPQAMEFSEILSSISNIYIYNDQDLDASCNQIPRNYAAIRNRYLDGRKAITKYLPVPKVNMLDNHSYISVNACLVDFMLKFDELMMTIDEWKAYYNSSDYDDTMLNLKNSDKIKSIVDVAMQKVSFNGQQCIPLFMKMWSDDFDPNKSVKSNRQSIWLKTITIFTFISNGKMVEHTYPMGLSKKGMDHDELDKKIEIEIQAIRNANPMVTMYSRAYKSSVSVYVDYYCIMNDQPERRKNLGLALGNSAYHKRMGYVMDYKQAQNVIRSCERCSKSIFEEFFSMFDGKNKKRTKEHFWRTKTCKKCTGFLYDFDSKLLHYKPEANFPTFLVPPDGKMRPQRITRHYLEEIIYKVHCGLKVGELKKNDAHTALRCHGLNGDFIDQIVEHGCKALRKCNSEDNRQHDPHEYELVRADYKQDKLAYKMHRLPCSWFGKNHIKLYVDVPMHLLFLGIMKSAMIKTTRWLHCKRLYSTFLSYTKDILEPIDRMNLEWCKLLKYPSTEKFGGWVSENYLGMSRLCTWFYSLLLFLPQTEPYEDPPIDLPLTEWSRNQLRGWLDARKLPKNGKICDMVKIIQEYRDTDKVPIIQANTWVKVADLLRMFYSLNKMISYMMSYNTKKNDIDKLEVIIRMFLINYDMVDKGLSYKELPSFMSQYNFLCLLNIPETMRQYGSMRNMWEGGIVGEGFLRGMKKEMKQGMIGNWQVWTLKNLLENDLYNDIVTQKQKKIKDNFISELQKECVIHKNEEQASNAYASGQPISGFIINNNRHEVYIVYRDKKQILCKTLFINFDEPLFTNFQNYYRITFGKDEEDQAAISVEDFNKIDLKLVGVLLLPRLNEAGYEKKHENTMYCIVQSEWMSDVIEF